jgi:cellulose synthase/poly-beta-1,6-N-acetylglucosamine synthase-like glycosyltransferase
MINLLILVFLILLFYYSYFLVSILIGLLKLKPVLKKEPVPEFVSIIIPFRNEEDNILLNLQSIESQNYPKEKFEVIYIDDSSTDNSLKILKSSIKNENIKVFSLPENRGETAGKKRAVNYGIENSRGEIIVTTDADCIHSHEWLVNLLSALDDKTGFISGPIEFINEKNIFTEIQQIEFAGLILTGAGLIQMKRPVICNAANIAYRKSVFEKLNGFQDHLHISSGDDAFLMQKIHKDGKYGVKFCLNKDAVVKTKSAGSIQRFYQQRKRWASKNIYYSDRKLIIKLILIFFFYLSLVIQFLSGFLVSKIFFFLLFYSLFIKFLLEFLILKMGNKILFPGLKLRYFLLAELFQIPYILLSGVAGLFGNFTWKERKVKR